MLTFFAVAFGVVSVWFLRASSYAEDYRAQFYDLFWAVVCACVALGFSVITVLPEAEHNRGAYQLLLTPASDAQIMEGSRKPPG